MSRPLKCPRRKHCTQQRSTFTLFRYIPHAMTSSILEQQINLRQLTSDTFAAGWHPDWAIGPSKSFIISCCVVRVIVWPRVSLTILSFSP